MSHHHHGCSCGCHEEHSHHHEHHHDHHKHEHNEGRHHHHGHDCFHEHVHEDDEGIIKEHGFDILKILSAGILLVFAALLPLNEVVKLCLYAAAYLISAYEIIIKCVKNLIHGEIFDENFLMTLSSVVAFILGEYFEGVLIVLLFSVGELLEHVAIGASKKKIKNLSELKVTVARLYDNGNLTEVQPDVVEVGSVIQVNQGDIIPIDGELLSDYADFDLKAVTGESRTVNLSKGEKAYSGGINVGAPVLIKTTALHKDSTAEKIIKMVEDSVQKKAKTQKLISKFARIYTPIVVILALIIAFIPQFFLGDFAGWVYKALAFLVVSCPCALVISVPLSYFIGVGSFAKKGILVKGGIYIETLSKVKTVIFDKTGTLTKGVFTVEKIDNYTGDLGLIEQVCNLEKNSNHPIAKALISYATENDLSLNANLSDVKEHAGLGVSGVFNGKTVYVGNLKLMRNLSVDFETEEYERSIVYVAADGKKAAKIYLKDNLKENTESAIKALSKVGVNKKIILSGDNVKAVESIAKSVKADGFYAQLLPEDKVNKTREIMSQTGGAVAYVGDGINDAPVIALSDVGIAMGALGSESAIESSDVVIMDDDLRKIALSVKHAKKIRRIVIGNIVFSLAAKLAIMCLSVFVNLPLWVAVAGDVGIMLIAILNSIRNYRIKG